MWCIMRKYYKNNFWKYPTNLWLKTAISDSGHKTKDARTTFFFLIIIYLLYAYSITLVILHAFLLYSNYMLYKYYIGF